jgi:glutamate--cysteine ligase
VSERGREPVVYLEQGADLVVLADWGGALVAQLQPIARQLDAAHQCDLYSRAVASALTGLNHPETLPSARVLQSMTQEFGGSFRQFVRAQSLKTRQAMLEMPLADAALTRLQQQSRDSVEEQLRIEANDSLAFDVYLREYLSAQRLVAKRQLF